MSSTIKLEELKGLCKEMFIQKAKVAKLKEEKTAEEKILTSMKENIIYQLEQHELKGFDTGFGKVSRKNTPYAKITDKELLTVHLKERGIFEDMVTLNASKMKSYYLEEMDIAKAEKNLDFKIEGMEISSNRKDLSITGVKLKENEL